MDRVLPAWVPSGETDLRRVGAGGRRWRGVIGPSLYMTAVEAAPPRDGSREHGEKCGRFARLVARLNTNERVKQGWPAWRPLPEALAQPGEALRVLIEAAQIEAAEHGDAAAREAARSWLRINGSHGLDPCAKSAQTTTGHGFRGLTVAGRRCIRDATALLAEHRGSLAFGTVTLPDDAAETITRSQLATFQSRWLFYASRLLKMRGLPPLLVLVAEIHPKRKTLSGGPVIHWHWCAKVSHGPYQPWAAKTADWHRVTAQAHFSAFGKARGHTHGCRTEAAKTDPGKYLSKYLTKACSDCRALIGTEWERSVPRQWWTWTGELRSLVMACRIKPPSGFLAWCCRWARELADLGEAATEVIQIGEGGPIVGRWFAWRDEAALDRAIEAWIGEELARLDELQGLGPPP